MRVFFTAILLFISVSVTTAQSCVPSWQGSGYGIIPDTAVNLPPAFEGQPYSASIHFRVPLDTTVKIGLVKTNVHIYYIRVDSGSGIEAIPALVPFASSNTPSSGIFKGDSTGCVLITGTPAMGSSGTYVLTVHVTAHVYVKLLLSDMDQKVTVNSYRIKVYADSAAVGVTENKFASLSNFPNPASNSTRLNYFIPNSGTVNLKVYSVLGELAADKNLKSLPGLNEYDLDVEDFNPGIYFYTLTSGESRATRRLVITR